MSTETDEDRRYAVNLAAELVTRLRQGDDVMVAIRVDPDITPEDALLLIRSGAMLPVAARVGLVTDADLETPRPPARGRNWGTRS